MSQTQTCGWCAEEIPADATRCPKCQGNVADGQAMRARGEAPPLARRAPVVESKPKAPAGWYPHPTMADTRRYWDGQKWTQHIAPAESPAPPSPAAAILDSNARKDDTSYVWALVLLPLALAGLIWAVPKFMVTGTPFWIIGGVGVLLALLDQRRLTRQGFDSPAPAWVLLIPGYLISRTRRVGSAAIIPILWFATMGVFIVTGFIAPVPTDWTGEEIATDIESQLNEKFSVTAVVTCPSIDNALDGDSIECDVEAPGEAVRTALVEFDNDAGYTWQLQ